MMARAAQHVMRNLYSISDREPITHNAVRVAELTILCNPILITPPDPFQGSPHKDRIGYEYLILKEKLRKWLCSAVHSEFWRERGILLFVDCFVWVAISLDGYE